MSCFWIFVLLIGVESLNALKIRHSAGVTDASPASASKDQNTKMAIAARLAALRAIMASQPTALAAYVIPTADAHNSEYIAPTDARREWISGFTGSAGTAVVTSQAALVWTDGRYYTQFEKETDPQLWTLMKQSLPETPSLEKWLSANLTAGAAVGADPRTMTRDEWTPLESALGKARIRLLAVPNNLVDEARQQLGDPPPPRPRHPLFPLELKYTGRTAGDKIKELREKMAEKNASALVITALDEVAYTLNLRGSDIEYNPVFFSYLVLRPASAHLYWGEGQIPPAVGQHLAAEGAAVEGHPYDEVMERLKDLAVELGAGEEGAGRVWLPPDASEAAHRAALGVGHFTVATPEGCLKTPLSLVSEVSPVALMKLYKNEVELQGFRACHVRDGTAVVRLLRWLHESVDAGIPVTEIQAADKLLEFRKEEADFMGPSFETISAAGAHGAIIHYSPAREGTQTVIQRDDMFLLDSGGQYRDGTTDITRTRHMGEPSAGQREAFTRVLKGQIAIGSAIFPQGVKGNVLDTLARKALWDVGQDYGHGTGHGVGHFLNVHEGPAGVSWRPYPRDPGLRPHQILSNEPGYYEVGQYGIRHEDLVEVIAVDKDSGHPRARSLRGDFEGRGALGFHTLTLAPHHAACIDVGLLDDFELSYLNEYHARVLAELSQGLAARGLQHDLAWLRRQCRPLARV